MKCNFFLPEGGTIDAVLILRKLQEECHCTISKDPADRLSRKITSVL